MPSHQERREPLPKGYQFGDAGRDGVCVGGVHVIGTVTFNRAICVCGSLMSVPTGRDWSPMFRVKSDSWNDRERGEH